MPQSFAFVLGALAAATWSGSADGAYAGTSALELSLGETSSPSELAAREVVQASGINYCKFANGSRQVPLAAGFFGPEPCLFGDGMVLRASDFDGGAGASAGALIWGFGAAAEKVALTIDGTPAGSATSDANGRWEITVKVPASPKASVLEFTGGASKKATLSNVLFGDVWLCSGQSNMDFSVAASGGGGCFAQNETVALAASGKYNDIRLMHGGAANGHWWNASSNAGSDVAHFSAVCFLSALAMKQHIPSHKNRPMGLVQSSVGGTVIEMWMSPQALEQCLPANESVSGAGCAAGSQFNSNLYYELIDPLAPLSLTGTLWCESHAGCRAVPHHPVTYCLSAVGRIYVNVCAHVNNALQTRASRMSRRTRSRVFWITMHVLRRRRSNRGAKLSAHRKCFTLTSPSRLMAAGESTPH